MITAAKGKQIIAQRILQMCMKVKEKDNTSGDMVGYQRVRPKAPLGTRQKPTLGGHHKLVKAGEVW